MLMDFVRNAGCNTSIPFDLQSKVQERLTCISEQHRRLRFYEEIVFHTGEPLPFAALEHKDTPRLGHLEDRHAEDRRGWVRASSGVDDIIGAYDDRDVRFRETTVDLVHVDKLVIRDPSLGEQYVHVTRHAACDRMYGIAEEHAVGGSAEDPPCSYVPSATTIYDLGIREYSSGRKSHSSPSTFGPFAFGLRSHARGAILRSLIWR